MNDTLAATSDALPRPRWPLWRTMLRRKRDLTRFAPPLDFDGFAGELPKNDEAAHWGEVILLEDHVSVLHRDGTISYGVHYVSMLHGDANIAPWEQLVWYYQTKFWRPTIRHALLRTPDGGRQPAGVFDRMVDRHSKLRMTQVAFGPMRRGVIIDIAHQTDNFQPMPMGPCTWGQFFLQTGPPCRRRRFTIAVAAPFTAQVERHHGAAAPERFDEGEYNVCRWELHNVPGIEWDAWTPPLRDFGPWIDFTTLLSWAPVAAQYRKEIAPSVSYDVRALARELTTGARTDREKLAAIYRYAAQQVRYGRPPQEMYLAASRPASKVFEDLRGDCKDKSTLIVSMLRALDLEAEVALVTTRARGQAPFLPAPRFDHALVIARLENQVIWIDAASGLFNFGDVPYQDQGTRALVLADDACDYIEAPPPLPEHHGVSWLCQGSLGDDGGYCGKLRFTAHGERASLLRTCCEHRNRDFRDRLLRQMLVRGIPGAFVSDLTVQGIDDLSCGVSCECQVRLTGCGRALDGLLLVQLPWAEPVTYDGPLAASDRPQPLAAPLVQTVHERHEITLSPGLTGCGLPLEVRHECEWATYENSVHLEGARLTAERRLVFLGGIVVPHRYAEIRDFWAECARADVQTIVLRRRSADAA